MVKVIDKPKVSIHEISIGRTCFSLQCEKSAAWAHAADSLGITHVHLWRRHW